MANKPGADAPKNDKDPRDPKVPPPAGSANDPTPDLEPEVKIGDGETDPEPEPDGEPASAEPTPAAPAPTVMGLTTDDREALFLSHLVTARADDARLELAMEQVRLVRKGRNRNRNLCKTDGFSLKYLDEILEDEVRDREEVARDAELRTSMRTMARQPVIGAAQRDLFEAAPVPPSAEDDRYWVTKGFDAGFLAEEQDPAKHGIPPGHETQLWLEGWNQATALFAARMKRAQEINEGRQGD